MFEFRFKVSNFLDKIIKSLAEQQTLGRDCDIETARILESIGASILTDAFSPVNSVESSDCFYVSIVFFGVSPDFSYWRNHLSLLLQIFLSLD